MPPRRSTRTGTAPASPPPPSRTRGRAAKPDTDEETMPRKRAAVAKPASKVTKPASKAAAKPAAKATRSRRKTPTPEPESDADEDEEDEDEGEDDEEESEDDSEEEESEEEPAPKKQPASKAAAPKPVSRSKLASKAAPKEAAKPVSRGKAKAPTPEPESENDNDSDEEEEVGPKSVPSKRRVAASDASSEDEPAPKPVSQRATVGISRKSATPVQSRASVPSTPAKAAADDDSEPEDLLADVPKTPARVPPTPGAASTPSPLKPTGSLAGTLPPRTPGRPNLPGLALQPSQPARPKPRLTIHKLVLNNFKSYAGRQEIGPFHKSFSAIVGPNGSGKSNTIDALLFVFGYRASKMRQGKLSELIHNSAGKEGIESCSVEVWFREIVDLPGVDDFLLVPNSQLVVTREAFRNNSSKYTINDRTSSFTEVTTLLKGKGIDLDHNRFLILQGEVESIALMKAKAQNEHEDGLLEYLEDIIGTTRYKAPIEEASLQVDQLNEDRGEKMNRLRVVEREKAALEDKKREAESYLRDTNELTRKKSLLWQYHIQTLRENIHITTKSMDKLTTKLAEEQERNAHHLAEIEELQKAYNEKAANYEEVKVLTEQLVKDAKKIGKEDVGLQEKKKHLVGQQKKLSKVISDDGHVKSEALATVENCGEAIETNRKKVTELEKKLEAEEAELEEVRDSLKDKTDEFTTQIDAKQRELEPWTAKISDKQSAIDVAQSERDLLAQKATGAQAALEESGNALKELRQSARGSQDERKALEKEQAQAEKELKSAEAKLKSLDVKSEQLRTNVSNARQKTLEAKASLAADKSESAVLSSLNKLKSQGRIKGFHGRLGDLGVIDDKYDVAITTACNALNNLVVDTVEQGQACIEHLRKGNVGRASIIVLEKLPKGNLGPIDTPEGVPRLFDLIKPKDPSFAPAFYKAVRDTLVAKNLEQAQRIGYGKRRYRVVTLEGQVVDPSGTMSGGGTRVQRGGMSSKFKAERVAPEVVARYEKECAAAEEEFTSFQADKRDIEALVAQLRKRIPDIEVKIEKIDLDLQTAQKRISEAEKRVTELEAQSKPDVGDEKRIKALDAQIAAVTRDVTSLRDKASVISEQIKELQNKILEVGGVKLRAIQSKFMTTKGLLDLANESITKNEVGQAKAERDAAKADKSIAKNKAELEKVEGKLAEVESDLATATSDMEEIRAKVEEAQETSSYVKDELAQAKAELDDASTEVNAFRKLEMEIKQNIEDNTRVQKDSKDKLRHWEKRHNELELVFIDEEDEDEEDEGEKTPDHSEDVEAEADVEAEIDGDAEGEGEGTPAPKKSKKAKNDSLELVEYSPDELRDVDKEMLTGEITALEEEVSKTKPNLNVLNEYRRREAEFLDRARDLDAVTSERDGAKQRLDDLRKVRLDEFMAGFSAISAKLKEMYQMITMGGNAEIELVDTMDPFSEGVVLSIMPPKKSWRPIANLSGGEKTLASLALVFALHVFKPTPLYFMDEIDAALDFKNVSIVANYIQSKTQAAQFIVISLRNDMFELAHRLVGIYKTSNCTKSIAIDNKDLRTQAVRRKQVSGSGDVPPTPKAGSSQPSLPSTLQIAPTPAPVRPARVAI